MTWADEREELLRRAVEDQEARVELVGLPEGEPGRVRSKELRADLERIDSANTRWLKTMLIEYGWPLRSEIGDEASQAAWLLAQHADRDPDFQGQCMEYMRSVPLTEVNPASMAMLTDRVLLRAEGRQRYGTQWALMDGDWAPLPLEDEAAVDELRAQVSLGPLSEYRQVIAENHGKSSFLRHGSSDEPDAGTTAQDRTDG